jgi:hypothetical protein
LILLCQWHHTAVHEGGVTITRDSDGWLFTKPDGQPCESWVSDDNLARHLDFALLGRNTQRQQRDQLAGVDSSTTLTTGRFVPAGPVKSSTSTRASKPCSPSNSLNSRNKINKPRSQARVHRKGYGQHIGHADNTTVGSEDTSDNT